MEPRLYEGFMKHVSFEMALTVRVCFCRAKQRRYINLSRGERHNGYSVP